MPRPPGGLILYARTDPPPLPLERARALWYNTRPEGPKETNAMDLTIEIAHETGVSENLVKVRIHRAKEKLKVLLADLKVGF